MVRKITTPLDDSTVMSLKAGDIVEISGTIYAARDAAHKKMIAQLLKDGSLPFDVKGQVIYYVGPCPARDGQVIGSAGPTTSGRMDAYTPALLESGLKGMIGKGLRSDAVIKSMMKNKAVYFGAVGGAGALLSEKIIFQEVIAFPELGTEALRKLEVKNFPAVVIMDCYGNNMYDIGRRLHNKNT